MSSSQNLFQIPDGDKALPLRLADGIRTAIESGQLQPGEMLPSSRNLSEQLGVHRHTITAGLDQLVAEGWLTVVERQGFCVNAELRHSTAAAKTKSNAKHRAYSWKFATELKLAAFSPADDAKIDVNFQSGLPDLNEFPLAEFKACLFESLREAPMNILDYGSPFGWQPLRDAIRDYIKRKRSLDADTIVITNGSQEAIYMVSRILLKPGDRVAMEELSYPPARETFRLAGAELVPLPMIAGVLDPDSLKRAVKKAPIKMIFLTPTHQFPTTEKLDAVRRRAVYEICVQHGIIILEDDYDHEFHFNSQPPLPMASNDPAGLIIYVSTFSKASFPSARIGFLAAPRVVADRIANYRRITVHQNEGVMQDAFARWICDGAFERHQKRMLKLYAERRQVMTETIDKLIESNSKLHFSVPEGGLALWLDLGKNSNRVASTALEQGVFLTPDSYYHHQGKAGTFARLGFSNLTDKKIREGLKRILT